MSNTILDLIKEKSTKIDDKHFIEMRIREINPEQETIEEEILIYSPENDDYYFWVICEITFDGNDYYFCTLSIDGKNSTIEENKLISEYLKSKISCW